VDADDPLYDVARVQWVVDVWREKLALDRGFVTSM
jgi:hypothetical protein